MTTRRLFRRIRADFPEAGSAEEIARLVADAHETERVQAAIVLWASGDLGRFRDAVALAAQDWRDVLVRADLAHDDWPDKLDAQLGTDTDSAPPSV